MQRQNKLCLIREWMYFPGCKPFHQSQELFQKDPTKVKIYLADESTSFYCCNFCLNRIMEEASGGTKNANQGYLEMRRWANPLTEAYWFKFSPWN